MLADRLTILLIEDNPVDTRLIKEMCLDCETVDLDILCESRLALGLVRLKKGGVSGVFLDLNLPDSLGIETLTRVDTEFPDIPIIVLTGQEDEAIAEDETGVRDITVRRLDALDYDTITAGDGDEGVRIFRERLNDIDLVMLDFAMPKMNGVEAFGELIRTSRMSKSCFAVGTLRIL
ncbi:MAG: response regulator [Desulfomonilaceae bacterium]